MKQQEKFEQQAERSRKLRYFFLSNDNSLSSRSSERQDNKISCVISGFRREVDEICALPGYYAVSSDNFLTTFRDNL